MARRISTSQFKSQMRQVQNNINRQVRKYNSDVKRAVNQYNSAVRQYNTKRKANISKIQRELSRLNSTASNRSTITVRYSTSVNVLNSTYERIAHKYDDEQILGTNDDFMEILEQENANSLHTANIIQETENNQESLDISLQESELGEKLKLISDDLNNRWLGALFSLNPVNPDAARHFCTSTREVFTDMIDLNAKDADVFELFPNCEKTDNGNATRRFKIKYFLKKKNIECDDISDFVEQDIINILDLFHVLSDGTHGSAGKYSIMQLKSIKKRVEDGLNFLCGIVS